MFMVNDLDRHQSQRLIDDLDRRMGQRGRKKKKTGRNLGYFNRFCFLFSKKKMK